MTPANIKEIPQKGVYSGYVGRKLYEDTHYSKDREVLRGGNLIEEIDREFEEGESGGIITFSTDVTAVELSQNKLSNWIKQKISSIGNRLSYGKKIDKIASEAGGQAWTVGKYLDGRYKSKDGKSFSENSLSVEVIGITSEQLLKIAENICSDFKQESVLVKDFSEGKIYLVTP